MVGDVGASKRAVTSFYVKGLCIHAYTYQLAQYRKYLFVSIRRNVVTCSTRTADPDQAILS
jgi:hypothetical protein